MGLTAETLSGFVRDLKRMRDRHVPQFVQQVETALAQLEAQTTPEALAYVNRERSLRQNWADPGDDQGMQLFHLAYQVAGFEIESNATILEIGSEQTNFASQLREADPTLQILAVDYNAVRHPDQVLRLKQDIMTAPLLDASFDWVIALSSLEHIGLGHYDQDPLDVDGDIKTMQRVRNWLKPGGSVYFDVPWHPREYSVEGTSHRIYSPEALVQRMMPTRLTLRWQGFSGRHEYRWTTPPSDLPAHDYWYTGCWLTKDLT